MRSRTILAFNHVPINHLEVQSVLCRISRVMREIVCATLHTGQ